MILYKMSEIKLKSCMVAASAGKCVELLQGCMRGDKECFEEYSKLKAAFKYGIRATEQQKADIKKFLAANEHPILVNENTTKTADEIIKDWVDSLPPGPEREKIRNNLEFRAVLMLLVEFVIHKDFSGDPATMKTSKMWFSTRPNCTNPKVLFSGKSLSDRPTSRTRTGLGVMVGGGSQNERKNISYVNKIRYLDSLNSYYSMVGGASEPTNCAADLQRMYENITSNLQNHGKQVEDSDNRIIETMLNKFSELESKVAQIQENISKLSEVAGANVSEVLKNEKEKLKTVSNYLSTQGKNITSVIRNLFESSSEVPVNNKTLTNARLQFPQHTVN